MMLLRLVSVSLLLRFTRGFSNVSIRPPCHDSGPTTLFANQQRRSFLSNLGGGVALIGLAQEAFASGGATAGGAYLLSAKQRYNERVEQGVSGFLGIKGALEGGDINAVRDWFSSEQVGGWKDFSAAGYLLANAFRRNSTTPPDSLPSVKAWKGFAARVEAMTKSLKAKDVKGAAVTYESSIAALDTYLGLVELPSSAEIK